MESSNLSKESGFTLLEILIAMSIFSVGILAVAGMQISSIRGNDSAAGFTEALIVGQSKLEYLSLIPYTDPLLGDTNGVYPANKNDHAGKYDFFWSVDDIAAPTAKKVKLRVQWKESGTRQIEIESLILP
ncbi:MAG: prepilin-type N-terminal cleavage/methylation domain-containing protein [Desulfamplus sp.]|nr:prepilin-type N-terminal cleavage/methylation domain-containing protein [Desulfamplus sp.]